MQSSTDESAPNNSDIVDNINDTNNKKVIKHRNRPDKKTRFSKEREEIINKLNGLIGLDNKNNSVFLYELEKNPDLKTKIEEMLPEIKKYHKYGNWGYFSNDPIKGYNNHIALLRAIYNDNNYDVLGKHKIAIFDNIKKQYTQLLFYKK